MPIATVTVNVPEEWWTRPTNLMTHAETWELSKALLAAYDESVALCLASKIHEERVRMLGESHN